VLRELCGGGALDCEFEAGRMRENEAWETAAGNSEKSTVLTISLIKSTQAPLPLL
jgi:hypothetical protein